MLSTVAARPLSGLDTSSLKPAGGAQVGWLLTFHFIVSCPERLAVTEVVTGLLGPFTLSGVDCRLTDTVSERSDELPPELKAFTL